MKTKEKEITDTQEEPRKYFVDVFIPPECLDEDGGPCEHSKEEDKKQQNPV